MTFPLKCRLYGRDISWRGVLNSHILPATQHYWLKVPNHLPVWGALQTHLQSSQQCYKGSTTPLAPFFLRKISPELTCAANSPLSAEEDWPWANIRVHLPLLYTWDACHSMAFAKRCHVRTCDLNPRTLGHRSRTCTLNPWATQLAPIICFIF